MKCNLCRIGTYKLTTLSYFSLLDRRPVIIPNVLAYRCDMCGHAQFNKAFTHKLRYLLDQLQQSKVDAEVAEWHSTSEQLPDWQPDRRSS